MVKKNRVQLHLICIGLGICSEVIHKQPNNWQRSFKSYAAILSLHCVLLIVNDYHQYRIYKTIMMKSIAYVW